MNTLNLFNKNCYNCKVKPCVKGCPLQNDIPNFISLYNNNDFQSAKNILIKTTILSSICGRICPEQSKCESFCVQSKSSNSVSIGKIESIIGDYILDNFPTVLANPTAKKIAIVGSGPAGLTCAFYLKMYGHDVTIFEKQNYLGGLLQHGIPDFRLDKKIITKLVQNLINLGIQIKYNSELGKNIELKNLTENFDAVFLAIGANVPKKINIPGSNLSNVLYANEILEYNSHPNYSNRIVSVIGGGNVAFDVARTIAKKSPKKVRILYRRSLEYMPAEKKELEAAINEGVEICYLTNVISNHLDKIECIKTCINLEDKSSSNLEGTNFLLDNDYLVFATGSQTNKNTLEQYNFLTNNKNYLTVDANYMTSINKVFAGGDLIGSKPTVAWASFTGREAAKNINNFLLKN